MSIESVMPSNHLILCHPLLLPPSIFSSIRVFSNESVLHMRWPKYWIFSFSISPSNEYSGLISFRMDWLDFLDVQGTLKRLWQNEYNYVKFKNKIKLKKKQKKKKKESSPTLHFKSISSSMLSFPNSHIIHDYWKNHSFD